MRRGRDWEAIAVDIGAGEQFEAAFLAISPNNKIPALVDSNGPDGKSMALFESGAILLYLAAKTGKFLPKSDRLKFQTLQWLMFQMGGVGPMIGQTHHFRQYAPEKIEYAIARYSNETKRLYGVMDKQLSGSRFIACNQYTIADIAIYPWLRNWANHGIEWADYPHLKKWFDRIDARPAVQRGVKVLAQLRSPVMSDKEREVLFGSTQHQKR